MSGSDKKKDEKEEKGKKGGKSLILIIIIAVVVLGAGGGAAWFFLGKKGDEAADAGGHHEEKKSEKKKGEIPAPAKYFAMDPPFVVNLTGGSEDGPRYLQVEVQLMTRDEEALKHLEENAPAIRANLLMLFSQVKATEIADRAGKEKLQQEALHETQKLMEEETGEECVDELLFTSFVTQ